MNIIPVNYKLQLMIMFAFYHMNIFDIVDKADHFGLKLILTKRT